MNEKKTLKKEGCGLITDRKSEFYGYASPVDSEQQALEFIARIKKEHPDARHHVFAYSVDGGIHKRFSDDGEPQGSAGKPVLDAIEKNGLNDAVIVVVRYFGGILLGTGGLVRAYSGAASAAVVNAEPVVLHQCDVIDIKLSYNDFAKIRNLIDRSGASVGNVLYDAEVSVSLCIASENSEELIRTINDTLCGRAAIKKTGVCMLP